MEYNKYLMDQFKDLEMNIVKHDTSPTGCPAFIEVKLTKTPKDRGQFGMDLGNYIYRAFGISFQPVPEYLGKGKNTSVRYFLSWENLEPIRHLILKAFEKGGMVSNDRYLPVEFRSLIIQNVRRGVPPRSL